MRYNNYHKHDHVSNIFLCDSHVKTEDYLKRAKELRHTTYFTTNHGTGGDIFESLTLCKQYGIKCIFGIEAYIVPDPLEKDKSNYHIVIIPTTNKARKKLNIITSKSNIEGFYHRPRISPDDLLTLDKDDIYITTACVAGILKDEISETLIFNPLVKHFKDHVFLEVQSHNVQIQKSINKKCLALSEEYGLKLIAANDSHYIYPEQAADRLSFLKGKGINYSEEDDFILDYPDYDTMFKRFQKQGILSDTQIENAISNTLVFDNCEEIYLDKKIKMPTIYPALSADEKIKELKTHIAKRFKKVIKEDNISKEELPKYKQGIYEEMKVIEDTKEINTADYFLLNESLVDLAVNKYGGILTRTGRGSCGSSYINRILGMTQLDRFRLDIKLYPERFMSTARLLENKAMPDIDYNVVSQKPFVKAAKELLGENGCYPMTAYGTMQPPEAFRNVCRTHGLHFSEYNEVCKNLEEYKNDPKWRSLIDESNNYLDTIISASVHSCSHLLMNENILEELGVVRIGGVLCVLMTSSEADEYKYLKDDFLVVSVWKIISDTFKLADKSIIPIKELYKNLTSKIWRLFEDGITCTLNQVDSDWATELVKKYKPKTISEMSMFVGCLRPFFESWRDRFINREDYTTGSEHLDNVLSSTDHYILFQENLMQYFEWLGIVPAVSIGLIKKISKKKIRPEDFKELEDVIKTNWIKQTGSIKSFNETWQMIQGCMSYGFCSAHAVATATDALYGAYLKVNYPMEYYTTALTLYSKDERRTANLTAELSYFNIGISDIEFGKSKADYSMDKENRIIYKGIASVKYCNSDIANELYSLSQNKHYTNFTELLEDIDSKTSVDTRQLDILIRLNFFKAFGKRKKLLKIKDLYNGIKEKSKIVLPALKDMNQIKKSQLDKFAEYGISEYEVKRFSKKETAKMYKEIDGENLLKSAIDNIKNEDISIKEIVKAQKDFCQYITYVNKNIPEKIYIVTEFTIYGNNKTRPNLTLRELRTGAEIKTRIKYSDIFLSNPIKLYSVIKVNSFSKEFKCKKIEDKWIKTDDLETILNDYSVLSL